MRKRREGRERERWEREIEVVRTERQVWKVMGREKGRRRMEQWIKMKE